MRMRIALWALIAVYSVARVLQIFPGPVPMLAVVALHVFPPAIFALIHGSYSYRWRGMGAFCAIGLVVGNVFENVGVRTGFPFGHYYFTDLMGPKVLDVPVLLGLAYLGMAYLSWSLARVIVGPGIARVPLVAAFLMTAWDFSMDPVWSTLMHAWIWRDGGAYFGVPVSNFFGWYLTVYVFYQLFAIYLRSRAPGPSPSQPARLRIAVAFYGISAAGNLLLAIPPTTGVVVSDATGAVWRVTGIAGACVLVSIFTMGAFTLMGWVKTAGEMDRCE